MSPSERLSAEQRKLQIIAAAMPVFAEKGFSAATTKEIAEAAGVSEALLYKHFPNKESLYQEMYQYCCDQSQSVGEGIVQLEPGTDTLIKALFTIVYSILLGFPQKVGDQNMVRRLVTYSILEDGEFARQFLKARFIPFIPFIEKCIERAKKEGSIHSSLTSGTASIRIWMAHHIPVIIGLFRLPAPKAAIDYEISDHELLTQAVYFVLRGVGLKEEVIQARFKPKALIQWIEDVSNAPMSKEKKK